MDEHFYCNSFTFLSRKKIYCLSKCDFTEIIGQGEMTDLLNELS